MSEVVYDVHMHLNGSVSLPFLLERAKHFGEEAEIAKFVGLSNSLHDIAAKFRLVHKLLRTSADIRAAVIDVVQNHPAQYLEIRTTPRSLGTDTQDLAPYVQAFTAGIRAARELVPEKKVAGLLSIDRFQHDAAAARRILQLGCTFPHEIVGIDISGYHPTRPRILIGDALGTMMDAVLASPLGLAIHCGECDSVQEHDDSRTVLKALAAWRAAHPEQTFAGKVRLGHVIFTDGEIDRQIRALHIPIEICPEAHAVLGWWLQEQAHPVRRIYPNDESPVLYGSDDQVIFGLDWHSDWQKFMNLGYRNDWRRYRFGAG